MAISLLHFIKQLVKLAIVHRRNDYGQFDCSSSIQNPVVVSNPRNIYIYENVKIGANSVLYATNARIIIKQHFVSAIGLKITTGQHERRIGRFLSSITEIEKNHYSGLDKDVIINEDVWAGFDVTIMAGVEIGRGCTIAAGSIVTHSLPPYCMAAGVPAKFIKFYWSIDQIIQHELVLYNEKNRYKREELERIFEFYKKT